jgi:hypothetical protein
MQPLLQPVSKETFAAGKLADNLRFAGWIDKFCNVNTLNIIYNITDKRKRSRFENLV